MNGLNRKQHIYQQIEAARHFFLTDAEERGAPATSRIAGIIDAKGGMRVVVTQRSHMKYHVEEGEYIRVLPRIRIVEPVAWAQMPRTIALVEKYMSFCKAPVNDCGDCKACCKTMYIKAQDEDFIKHSHTWCNQCDQTFGCKVYPIRPKECSSFKCIWLKSQSMNDPMGPELRPDRCGVIFTHDTINDDKELFEMHVDVHRTDEPLNKQEVISFIQEQEAMGRKSKLITQYVDEFIE